MNRLAFCLPLLLAACAVGPDYRRPELALPPRVTAADAAATAADLERDWWRRFGSERLNRLVDEALRASPTVEAGQANLKAAEEAVAAQEGVALPQVGVGLSSSRQKTASVYASPLASNAYIYTVHTAQLSVGYSPDVFGLNRRSVEALAAQRDVAAENLSATRLTLAANVVQAAVNGAGLSEQLQLLRGQIQTQRRALEITQRLRRLGAVAEADESAQQLQLATLEAGLPPLERQLVQQDHQLKALLGRYPADPLETRFSLAELRLPAALPAAVPARLVETRPDVRAAEAGLRSANALVGVARANRLPALSITASGIGQASSSLSQLFQSGNRFWSLVGGLTQPVFDGGTLAARERAAWAQRDAAAALYRQTVLQAIQSVADSLAAADGDRRLVERQAEALRAAERAARIARDQVRLGDLSPLAALAAEQSQWQAGLALAQARSAELSDAVALCQAIAGTWVQETP
ncbi:efflux transporter outer membrane subunit [Pelomonas aquatica]|jgi:NodT family efflux transporter outer membrane factor (OMF) lipoprotein|uniref:Efflux transporter outer membrane subunit n=1 Tax=Pelomonas aquatica TaxID=431058 RepID=A0A9X4LKF2_9BURK|nr:efflux transporter outer membrane subunit [Pelomonas aquatica]MCY4757054.1 efflux transporter outer membrane subunit [Pelomonas aquatica]MDG0864399.1 efflux transporter outer membrane subunit [Pelomonas aquatica]